MANNTNKVTCISSDKHDDGHRFAIRDYVSHFLGCMEFEHRLQFFSINGELYRELMNMEYDSLQVLPDDNGRPERRGEIEAKMRRELENCIDELMRIDLVLKMVERSDQRYLIDELKTSRKAWRSSAEYQQGICIVNAWSHRGNSVSPTYQQLREARSDILDRGRYTDSYLHQRAEAHAEYTFNPESDIKVHAINWKYTGEELIPFTDVTLKRHFPDQVQQLNRVLRDIWPGMPSQEYGSYEDTYPSAARSDESKRGYPANYDPKLLRYFHFPANNMKWVESAIANYYSEGTLFRTTDRRKSALRSEMILRPQHWLGQQLGTLKSGVNTRHMRPLCNAVSSDPDEDDKPQNLTLFMPYLHWENSRTYTQISDWIEQTIRTTNVKRSNEVKATRELRQTARHGLSKPKWMRDLQSARHEAIVQEDKKRKEAARSWQDVLGMLFFPSDENRVRVVRGAGRLKRVLCVNPLGQYLLDAARLYEHMTNYRDKEFLAKYLHADPPLHPRRTLDQAYYGSLENSTEVRDRDQVVFRATKAAASSAHQYDPETMQWKEHSGHDLQDGCEHCRANIRKVSKLVMVDQLWMWILDANTVLTFFPRRYGTDEPDISGVHERIRARLKSAPRNRISSAFDLGLLVIEECASTFFDRTRDPDPMQPPVMELFADAIANATSQYIDASKQLWILTEHVKWCYQNNLKPSDKIHMALLDFNTEGRLHREIKDIVEEIDIMLHITRTQKDILKDYIWQVEDILNSADEFGSRATARSMNEDFPATEFQSTSPGSNRGRRNRSALPPHVHNLKVFQAFTKRALELSKKISGHVEDLEQLRENAQATGENIANLLGFKQQATMLQSWESARDAAETVNQGRAIMVFTVITIIFAPLSFMSAIFSMQNDMTWSFDFQIKLTLIISFCVALIAVLLAFSGWVRSFFASNSILYSPVLFIVRFLLMNFPWPRYSIHVLWFRLKPLLRNIIQTVDNATEIIKSLTMRQEWEWKGGVTKSNFPAQRKILRTQMEGTMGKTTGRQWPWEGGARAKRPRHVNDQVAEKTQSVV